MASFLEGVFLAFASYPYLISFLSGFISEEILILLAVSSGTGLIPFWIVFIFGFLGLILIDSVYFFVGKTRLIDKLKEIDFLRRKLENHKKFFKKVDRSSGRALFVSKFVLGTRFLTILFLSSEGIGYGRFIVRDIIGAFAWVSVFLPLGWLAGKGLVSLLGIVKNIELFLVGPLVVILFYFFIKGNLRKSHDG